MGDKIERTDVQDENGYLVDYTVAFGCDDISTEAVADCEREVRQIMAFGYMPVGGIVVIQMMDENELYKFEAYQALRLSTP